MGASTLKGNSPNFTKCTKCRPLRALISLSALIASPKAARASLVILTLGPNPRGILRGSTSFSLGPARAGSRVKIRGEHCYTTKAGGSYSSFTLPISGHTGSAKGGIDIYPVVPVLLKVGRFLLEGGAPCGGLPPSIIRHNLNRNG